ncbi:MAG: endonuclease/exonuclease/phosphatase family protein [Planctomycetota bacterium]|nr:endonuclease/exonuclease/phosphatase family protein [Planctomycetota bacterium]
MNQKAILALVAVVLVLAAVGGVVGGLALLDATEEYDAPAGIAEESAASAPGVVERAAAGDDPMSFVRFGITAPPARTPGAIRLATYNVENLFDDQDDPDLSGRYEDIDDTKPQAHLQALADTIRALDADVLALQEIESEAVIRWFRDTYLADLGYEYLASIDAGDERGIEQAVLSRFPIASVTNWPRHPLGGVHPDKWGNSENWHAGEPLTFHRSPMRVVVEIPRDASPGAAESSDADAYRLTLYVVHAKSGRPGEYWRLAEARGLVNQIRQQLKADPDANVVVLGDFNAFLGDESVQTLVGAGFADAIAPAGQRNPRFATHASGRRIDHILVNDNLQPELVAGRAFVLGTPSLPEGVDYRQEWRPDGYASDHFPVVIEIVPVDVVPLEGATGG